MNRLVTNVNPLQGTRSTREFSLGNTLPLSALPWGMHHWTFQTASPPWLFHPDHPKLQGIRLTHQPSPWIRDYASLLISAFHGPADATVEEQASAYRVEKAVFSPHYMSAQLLRFGIEVELSPTPHGAVLRFNFDRAEEPRLRLSFERHEPIVFERGSFQFAARSTDHHGGAPENFGLELVGRFSAAPVSFQKTADGGIFIFSSEIRRLELRLAGSFISRSMAQLALERELIGHSFEEIRQNGADIWEDLLGRIEITEAHPEQRRTFYSCLYRCLLFPRFLNEIDQAGNTVPLESLRWQNA